MSTLYLHIGTPKTGTTSLQNFLALNAEVLEKHGVCFPDFGFEYPGKGVNRNGHFLITTYYRDEEGNRILEKEQEDYERGMRLLAECAGTHDKIILSDEGLWMPAVRVRTDFWDVLKDSLASLHIDLKIIVYLRRQDLFAQSHWAQKVKEGACYDFQEYLETPTFLDYPLDYYAYMRMLAERFGKESLIIRVFEKSQFRGEEHTIYSDFLDIFGLKLSDGFDIEQEVYNTSLEGDYLEIKRILNALPEFHSNKHMLIYYMRTVQDMQLFEDNYRKTTCFKEGEQEAFMERFNEGNEKVAREFLNREDGRLFREDVADLPEYDINTEQLLRDTILVYGKVVDVLDQRDKVNQEKIANLQAEVRTLRRELRTEMHERDKRTWDLLQEVIEMSPLYRTRRKFRHLTGQDQQPEEEPETESEDARTDAGDRHD